MSDCLEAVRLYFEERNRLWVHGDPAPLQRMAAAGARWWERTWQTFACKQRALKARQQRIVRAHTVLRVDPPVLDAGGVQARICAEETVLWVYPDGPDFAVESRVIRHLQQWVQQRGRWHLADAWEADEQTPLPVGQEPVLSEHHLSSGPTDTLTERSRSVPRLQYDRIRALRYADLWWNRAHPGFVFLADDCTNFASQCLWAGQMPMSLHPSRAVGWWYRWGQGRQPPDWSYSWTTAHALFMYLTLRAGAEEKADARELRIGDLVFYDWDGTGRLHHTTVVTDFDYAGDPLVNAHTVASYRRHYRYLDSRAWTPQTRYRFVHVPDRIP
ncbi:MAG: amidase domain-containing protein [Alicyclobacillus sp.]|nr:amidase domain-containing protein [Alicyclobacillus sp.]